MKRLITPITEQDITDLRVGDMVLLSGKIYCGRDAVLPKICQLIEDEKLKEHDIDLEGSVIFHTAVSPAGVGPTSSNKLEIEGSFPILSKAGVKLHLGKGAIKKETIALLEDYNSVFAVIPPVTALLGENTISQRVAAFPELGMEAFYELEVKEYPVIIAAAHNESIY
ncbi:fumarate hydratase C-terminal domain-containing protein [Mediterraneibacter glycyrrhizinilyticus]|nr:fumarate hydratase C-terminal domain-containing protein [Mediterraneibacter glycyrrhizinilyticus]MBM6853238.1 fumarate hydratase C-terminal domain-containing protein [Mediterraneibacter glycyrrhizinilyticus]